MTDPGTNRNPWVLWLTNSGIAAVWGACSGLIAIFASRIVARVEVRETFWDGDLHQAVIVLAILLILTAGSSALFTTKNFRSSEPFRLRFGICFSVLTFCALGYIGFVLAFVEILDIVPNDHVFVFTMIIGVVPSPYIVLEVSERVLNDRHPAG